MAKITVTCPKCFAEYQVDETLLGRTGHCNKCNTRFLLSRPVEAATRTYLSRHTDQTAADDAGGESSTMWKLGDVILDVYEVCPLSASKPYAEGGMGIVYRVHHHGWGIDLAVKSPKASVVATEEGKANFERECVAWIRLGLHPNIVTCYYVRRIGGIPRVFAEFVEGGSLWEWIRSGRLYEGGTERSLRRVIDIAIQCAWGLAHAHEQGLIHQDVKPENVMMQDGVPKMTDFGLAKACLSSMRAPRDTTQASLAVSWGGMTPAYCSPEQIQAALEAESGVSPEQRTKLTRRTDIWSWALTVLAMFCGRPPCRYGGHTAAQVFETYLKKGLSDTSLPRMPRALAELLRWCFQHDPDRRPIDMVEIADRLRPIYREATGSRYARQQPVIAELRADTLNNRAASMLDLGNQEEAARLLKEAWEQHPWQPQVTFNRGILAWRTGRMTDLEFVAQLEELCATRPSAWEAHYALALAHMERGEMRLARTALEQAIDLGGGHEAHLALQQAAEYAGAGPRCVRSFTGQAPFVTSVYLGETGRQALSGIDRSSFRLWDVPDGRLLATFQFPSETATPAISADNQWQLVRSGKQTFQLRAAGDAQRVETFRPISWGSTDSLTTDNRYRLVVAAGELELRDAAGDELVRTFRGHAGPIRSFSVSRDGRWVLTGSSDKTLRFWELATGRCVRTLRGHTDAISTVYLAGDASWALSVSTGQRLRLWNLELLADDRRRFVAPVLLCHVTTSEEATRAQADFADLCLNARMALANQQYDEALTMIRSARMLPGYKMTRDVLDLWSRAGSRCVRRQCRDAWGLQVFEAHQGQVLSVALSDDAAWAVSAGADRTIRIWQIDSGTCRSVLAGHTDWVRSVAISRDGRLIVSAGWDKTVRVWDASDGRCLQVLSGHTNCVNSACFSPGANLVASGGWDKAVRVWDLRSGNCLHTFQGHEKYVNAVDFSPGGRFIVSAGEDNILRVWDLATGCCRSTLEGHDDWVYAARFSFEGSRIVSGGKDRTIRIWDAPSGQCLQILRDDLAVVKCVFPSSDGRWLLSGGKDKLLRLWDLEAGASRRTLEGHTAAITSACLSADGRWALSGDEDGTVRFWEIDWEYEFPGWVDWDEQARPHLLMFLQARCPLTPGKLQAEVRPQWSPADFEQLLVDLQHRGLGWIRPQGIETVLEEMAANWSRYATDIPSQLGPEA